MRLRLCEIAGWLLLLIGLVAFYHCFVLLYDRRIIETGPTMIIGFIVFRGGIRLITVAVAGRVCLAAQERKEPEPEVRGQRSEVRGQRSEVRGQRSGIGSRDRF